MSEINMKNRQILIVLIGLLAAIFVSIPAFAENSSDASNLSTESRAHLLNRLKAAKKVDWAGATDPSVSPVRHESFLNQMNKADRVMKELEHGLSPSQVEVNDALWSPPKHLSAAERANLIRQLEQARQQDDAKEQQILRDVTWARSSAPVDSVDFDQRKQQIDELIKDLQIGAPVHWTDIRQALTVPSSPY
jgi:hypothetical protein